MKPSTTKRRQINSFRPTTRQSTGTRNLTRPSTNNPHASTRRMMVQSATSVSR